MNDEMFSELLQSVREGGAILRGEAAASRTFVIEDPDVGAIRRNFNLSQPKFAAFLGISTRTLQNWEQKRRNPEGPAKVLLQVAAKHPEAVLDVVSEKRDVRHSKASPNAFNHSRRVGKAAKKAPVGFTITRAKKAAKKSAAKKAARSSKR